jgi:DNA (cytosine-5)-methyltransferase 1
MLRVIKLLQPRWICAENVAGLTTISEDTFGVDNPEEDAVYTEKILSQILEDIEETGYSVPRATTGEAIIPVIPARAVGCCHRRDRVFIIASNDKKTRSGRLPIFKGGSQQENADVVWSNQNDPHTYKGRCDYGGFERGGICWEPARFETGADHTNVYCTGSQRGNSRSSGCGESSVCAGLRNADDWSEVATRLCRVDDGVSNRVHRIECLGNAVVPQQVYPILKAIADIERGVI